MHRDDRLTVELITIGSELLDGTVADTNTAYLGATLTRLGARIIRATSIPDDLESIEAAVERAMEEADVVVTTGGLGPTTDDRTKRAVSRLFGSDLVLDDDVLARVRKHFESRGLAMPQINAGQALIPQGARAIDNPEGTAPGLLFERDETLLFVLPGVPCEAKAMVEGYVVPFLEGSGLKRLNEERLVRTTGVSESQIAELVEPLAKRLARTEIEYLPSETGVDLRILSRGDTLGQAAKTADLAQEKVAAKLGDHVYSRGDETLEQVVGYLLTMAQRTVAVAESCTGGQLGERFTSVAGSSDYFEGGVIAYSDKLKRRLLGIRAETLRKHGAVSAEVASGMARGVRAKCGADYGLGVTGIAGPGGGSPEKPVGVVFISVSAPATDAVREFRFTGGRASIRMCATQAALDMLRRVLLNLELQVEGRRPATRPTGPEAPSGTMPPS